MSDYAVSSPSDSDADLIMSPPDWLNITTCRTYHGRILPRLRDSPPIPHLGAGTNCTDRSPLFWSDSHWKLASSPLPPQQRSTLPTFPSAFYYPMNGPPTCAPFQRAFELVTSLLSLDARITATSNATDGIHISIDTLINLNALWDHRVELQHRTGWELRPIPPPLIWIRLLNVPRPAEDNSILSELFHSKHPGIYALRHLRHEVRIRKICYRRAYLQIPPEIRQAIYAEPELTLQGRWIRSSDYLHVQVCGLCSSPYHNTWRCNSEEYLCGKCAQCLPPYSGLPNLLSGLPLSQLSAKWPTTGPPTTQSHGPSPLPPTWPQPPRQS